MTATMSTSTAETRSEPEFDSRLIDAIRRILRALEVHSSRLESRHEVTGSQLTCLRVIADGDATTATAISRQVHLSPSTIVGILDRLERKGMIERTRDAQDRRVLNVAATRSGRRLAARAPSLLHELAASLTGEPAVERERVAGALEAVAARIDGLIRVRGDTGRAESQGDR